MPRAPKPVISDKGINFGQLGSVVDNQLAADAKYDREDAAKFRAVAQKVPTYEDFENIVIGSHLKPMKEDVTDLTLKRSAWDSTGRSKTRARRRDKTAAMGQLQTGKPTEAPPTVQKFMRDWRRNCPSEVAKYNYLLLCGAELLKDMFRAEVPDGQLGPVFLALNAGFDPKDAAKVRAIVDALATTGRYALAVDFMMDDEEGAYKALMAKLATGSSSSDGSPGEADVSQTMVTPEAATGKAEAESTPAITLLEGGALEQAAKEAAKEAAAAAAGGSGGSGGDEAAKKASSPRRMQIVSDDEDSDDESECDSDEPPPLEEVPLENM